MVGKNQYADRLTVIVIRNLTFFLHWGAKNSLYWSNVSIAIERFVITICALEKKTQKPQVQLVILCV